jgi:hypothetical protein
MSQVRAFHRAADRLDAAGLVWWVSDGAALGAVRHGKFLPSDPDVDIGFWADDLDAVKAAFEGHRRHPCEDLKYKIDGFKIDLHPHVRTGNTVWFNLGGLYRYRFDAHLFDQLVPIRFEGRDVLMPADGYLQQHYGHDWQTPRGGWRWNQDPPCLTQGLDLGVVTAAWGDYGRFLPDWVASIEAQPWTPTQVTVVDCGLTDPKPGRAALEASQLRWRWIDAPFEGFGRARNTAVAATPTTWISHLDADDIYLPTAFNDAHRLAPTADVIGIGALHDGKPRLSEGSAADLLRRRSRPPLSPSFYRRNLWEHAPYLTGNNHVESALWVGFAHQKARFAHTDRPGFVYRRRPDSHFNTRTDEVRRQASDQYHRLLRRWDVEDVGVNVRLSVVVMAHPDRAIWAEQLADQLGCPIVWDERSNLWDTARRAWSAYAPDATHHVVVQDDAILSRDFLPAARNAAHYAGNRPVSFYLGGVRPHFQTTSKLLEDARHRSRSWLETKGPHWAVSVMLPTADIDGMIAYGDGRPHLTADDDIMSRYYHKQRRRCWYTVPSLVDHRADDNPSLLTGRTLPDVPRQAQWFIGADRSGLDVDWSRTPARIEPHTMNGASMPNGSYHVANSTFAAVVDGRRVVVRKGKTRITDGHPLLKQCPERFDRTGDVAPVEQATAAPGEVRKTTRKKTTRRKKTTAKVDDT